MTRVVLHIDRLLLRGVARGDAPSLAAGMRAELESRLGDDPSATALTSRHDTPVVRAGTVRVPHRATAGAIGRAVAGRIVRAERP